MFLKIYKRRILRKVLVLFFFVTGLQISQAQSTILWKVSDTLHHKTSYIFGTFHLFGNSFVDSIPEIEKYLSQSELAVFESLDKEDFIRNTINQRKVTSEIEKKLRKKNYQKLLMISRNWKVDIHKLKPIELRWKLEQMLIRTRCNTVKKDDRWNHLDHYLQHLAKNHKIRMLGLETSEQQLRYIEREYKFPHWKDERKRISYLLNQLTGDYFNQSNCSLANQYRNYDLNYDFDKKCENSVLIRERNTVWMKLLPGLIKNNNCFIAVGLLHLYNNCGILQQLKEKGFLVEPVSLKSTKLGSI